MNGHMLKCIGGGGRNSSRDALKKIQNGNGNSSQNGYASGGSRHSTPAPSSQPNNKNRNSPNKRDPGDDFDSDSSPQKKQKIVKKTTTVAKKLKAPGMSKSASQHSASGLSFEQKPPPSDDEGEEDNDYFNKEWERKVDVNSKKKNPIIKKIIKPMKRDEKNWVGKMKADGRRDIPPILPPDTIKVKIELNGKVESREESESSQTLSSP
jgi:hypothetical protein